MPDSAPTNIARAGNPPDGQRRGGLFADYAHIAGVFDEMRAPNGEARLHFETLLSELDALGHGEIARRRDACEQIIHEQGITYTVYGDASGAENPWRLDPIPLVISQEEWRGVEKALTQRATLINRILADCYGKQDLIRTAWLPPALVFAQPDFLRPVHEISPPDGTFLHFYAADLARSPDGRWWVISDRTQNPDRRGLRASKPARDVAHFSRGIPKLPRAAACGIFPRDAGVARAARLTEDGQSPRRRAHAGCVQ